MSGSAGLAAAKRRRGVAVNVGNAPLSGSIHNKANSGVTPDTSSFTHSVDKASPTVKVLYAHERRIAELVNTVNQLVDAVDALNQHHVHYETRIDALEQKLESTIDCQSTLDDGPSGTDTSDSLVRSKSSGKSSSKSKNSISLNISES